MSWQGKYSKRNLPHLYIPGHCTFITYCLKNSIPKKVLGKLKEEQQLLDIKQKNKCAQENYKENHYIKWIRYFDKIDRLFMNQLAEQWYLQKPEIALIIKESLHFYDKKQYQLQCYCIMPNHVHMMIKLNESGMLLNKIMQSIKRYSAREANKLLDRKGTFWQDESYDHVVRNNKEFENIIRYILNNPVKAGLVKNWQDWPWSYLAQLEF